MLYELGYIGENGAIVRGGLKATITTVGRWIEGHMADCPDVQFMAIPANDEAVSTAESRQMLKEGDQ